MVSVRPVGVALAALGLSVCGLGQTPMGNHDGRAWYCLQSFVTLSGARAQAASMGGTLASIRSQANNDWVAAHLPIRYAWIGYTDEAVEGSFVWDDGWLGSFTAWALGEPDDNAGSGGNADGVAFDRDDAGGRWLDTVASFDGFVEGALITTPLPAPEGTPDSYSLLSDNPFNVAAPGVLGNDIPNEGTAVLVTAPAHEAAFSLADDGSFDYTPELGFSGVDSFTYKISNSTGETDPINVELFVYYPLSTLTANLTTLVGGFGTTGRVSLAGEAPLGGSVVNLASNSSKLWSPATAKVLASKTFRTFQIGTGTVTSSTIVTLTASFQGVTRTLDLTLNPGGLVSLGIQPSTLTGGQSATGSVRLSGVAPAGGRKVFLFSSAPEVSVPPYVIVLAGQVSRSFTVSSSPVTGTTLSSVIAKVGTVQRTVVVTVQPAG